MGINRVKGVHGSYLSHETLFVRDIQYRGNHAILVMLGTDGYLLFANYENVTNVTLGTLGTLATDGYSLFANYENVTNATFFTHFTHVTETTYSMPHMRNSLE